MTAKTSKRIQVSESRLCQGNIIQSNIIKGELLKSNGNKNAANENPSRQNSLGRSRAGLWGILAVVLLSVVYLMVQSGIESLKIAIVVAMLLTAGCLFNRGSRHFLILPAVFALLFSLMAFVFHLLT